MLRLFNLFRTDRPISKGSKMCPTVCLGLPERCGATALPANAEDTRDAGSIPGSGRSPGGGNGNPLQYSCLENPMDRGA